MEILTSEQTVHSAKCYIERDIGALEKPDKTCALVQGLGSFPRRGMWLSQLLVRTRNQLGQGSEEGCSSQREQDVQRPVGRENRANLTWVVWLGQRVKHKMSRKEGGSWAWHSRALFSGVLLHA